MSIQLKEVNTRVISDAKGFCDECEAEFSRKIDDAARQIATNLDKSRIVMLSGPSGSGKTTSSIKLARALESYGVGTESISMDDYFKTVDEKTSPRNEKGEIDYESPYCLDIELLKEHIELLIREEQIDVPSFNFPKQCRSGVTRPVKLKKNQVAIIEGIHALNDMFDVSSEHETKLYISARSLFEDEGKTVFKGTWTRLIRRIVRDDLFRGTDAAFTLRIWEGIRTGEKKYISPFKDKANIIINSTHPYEVNVIKKHLIKAMPSIPEGIDRYAEVVEMRKALDLFVDFDDAYVPEDSLLREFIGGGNFNY